jgi:hypothetical protein
MKLRKKWGFNKIIHIRNSAIQEFEPQSYLSNEFNDRQYR